VSYAREIVPYTQITHHFALIRHDIGISQSQYKIIDLLKLVGLESYTTEDWGVRSNLLPPTI